MSKLAEENKDLADQGLEKVLTQLDKVPGAYFMRQKCARGAVILTTPGLPQGRVTHSNDIGLQSPCVAPSVTLVAVMSTTVCSGE